MVDPAPTVGPMRLAVLGSPIRHSRSPALHNAAYRALGLPWSYEAVDVRSDRLAAFIGSLGSQWRGLSLTMPLKQAVLPLLTGQDELVTLTGAANTVLFPGEPGSGRRPGAALGFNTDIAGIVYALRDAGLRRAGRVQLLGGGATAASALAAAAELGANQVSVCVRSPERAAWLIPLSEALHVDLHLHALAGLGALPDAPDLVISTLPGTAAVDIPVLFPATTRQRALLLDVAYEPWPSALCRAWNDAGGTAVSGLDMLAQQALAQVRIFVGGDPLRRLPGEDRVFDAMRRAVEADSGRHRPVPES
ncbi:MAG: shikimate dehydrogenase [Microbacteriaceae bacterium]